MREFFELINEYPLTSIGLAIFIFSILEISITWNKFENKEKQINSDIEKLDIGTCEKCGTYDKLKKTSCYNYFHQRHFDKNICLSCQDDEFGLD